MKRDFKYKYLYVICTEPSSITNGLPGIYFGQHQTNDLNDGYIGSGTLLQQYLKKHPNKFERHILAFFDTKEELDKAEYEAIHDILNMPICLNLKEGGEGGGAKWPDERKKRMSQLLKGHIVTEETREKISKANKGRVFSEEQRYSFGNGNGGKHNTEAQKLKISQKLKGKKSPTKGKHKVWDNKELKKFHYE